MAVDTSAVRLRLGPGEPRLTDRLDELVAIEASDWTVALVPAASDHHDAGDRFGIEIKNARRALADAGAPAGRIDVVARALTELGHQAGPAALVVAAGAEVVVSGPLPETPDEAFVSHGPVPALIPALDLERHQVAHLGVLVDRTGADLLVVPRTGEISEEHLEGDVDVIHQPKAGGWSQPRFQQRARNTWDENAADVAAHVTELVDLVGAEVVVVSGDPKALPRLHEHLPSRVAGLVFEDDGPSRHHAGGLADVLDTAVADHVARRATSVLRELDEALATDRAVQGPEMVDLLGEGRIGRVVVSHDRRSALVGHVGVDTGAVVGTTERRQRLAESEDTTEVRLADLALWAGVRFGADIEIVPGGAASPNGGAAGFRRDA